MSGKNLAVSALLLLAVWTRSVFCREVKRTNQTLSCCDDVKILVDTRCRNEFSIESKVLAVVDGPYVETEEPFHYNKKEQVMMIKTCENFALHKICDKGDDEEENVEYQLNPCQKSAPDAAAVPPGFDLFVLIMALINAMFR